MYDIGCKLPLKSTIGGKTKLAIPLCYMYMHRDICQYIAMET